MNTNIKSSLEEYCALKKRLEKDESQLALFRKIIMSIERSMKYLNLREETMRKIIDVKRDILELESETLENTVALCDRKKFVFSVIEKIENREYREIFEQRYIEGKNWDEIAENLSYSTRNLYMINKKVLEKLEIDGIEK